MANILEKYASRILITFKPFVDFKFNESTILDGEEEDNWYAKKLYHEIFDDKILKSKTKSKEIHKNENSEGDKNKDKEVEKDDDEEK